MLNLLKSKPLFPLIFIVLAIFPSPTEAQVITICNDTSSNSNYPSNSQFQTNLNRLLTSLIANTSLTGFYNTTIGENPDRVYGLALCRGDISSQDCRSCVNTSTTVIISTGYCPNKKKATMKYNNCLIRYSDERFFSELVTEEWGYFWRGNNISNPDLFNRQLNSLMSNLSSTAASDDSKFQTGMGPYTDFTNIYGLVQCTRDLSGPDCLSCLQFALTKLPTCCYIKPGAEVVSLSCFIKYELFSFFRTSPPPPPRLDGSPTDTNSSTPPLPAPPKEGNKKNSLRTIIIISIPVAIILVVVFTILICTLRKKKTMIADVVTEDVVTEGEDTSRVESFLFDLTTIATATNNFSDANKLGQGGFGTVYKGILFDGQEIAVKRLSRGSTQGLEELRNEVVLLANLQHRNLVRLLGCCLGEQEKLLIYEYIPNTSLDKFLFDSIKRFTLDWQIRYKIIGGIARGLLYLHEDSQIRIIHRDLKASNILLAGDMSPKIADFGLARLFGGDQSEDNTNRIAGTLMPSAKPASKCSSAGVCHIYNNASAARKILLKQSVFGSIFMTANHSFIGELADALMSFYYKDNIFMVDEGVQVCFRPLDIGLIYGLRLVESPENMDIGPANDAWRSKYFTGIAKDKITRKDILSQLEDLKKENEESNEDWLKLCLFFVIDDYLLPTTNYILEDKYVRLIGNMEKFNNYPWGMVLHKHSMEYLRKARRNRQEMNDTNKGGTYNWQGYTIAFQL